jgi:hypothetical protein
MNLGRAKITNVAVYLASSKKGEKAVIKLTACHCQSILCDVLSK